MRSKIFEQLELFVINLRAGDLLENFLIAAVSTVLVVRTFLFFTGYPQLGGESLHIAHMLWGGFFMLIAIIHLLLFLTRKAKEIASVLGGIGFGLFIDELGKFITHDNNYFFEPAIALIYLIFIILFIGLRTLERRIRATRAAYGINALELLKEAVLQELDKKEKKQVLHFLNKADKNNQMLKSITHALERFEPLPASHQNIFSKTKMMIESRYILLAQNKKFAKAVVLLSFVVNALNLIPVLSTSLTSTSFWIVAQLISSFASIGLVIIGSYILFRNNRLLGFELLKYSALISIFLTQFFLFYEDQLSAIVGLFLYVTFYVAIRFLIEQEKTARKNHKA